MCGIIAINSLRVNLIEDADILGMKIQVILLQKLNYSVSVLFSFWLATVETSLIVIFLGFVGKLLLQNGRSTNSALAIVGKPERVATSSSFCFPMRALLSFAAS